MGSVVALTIAGSDPSGGAGIQADLKTFAAFGVYGAAVLTALTAQNTRGVRAVLGVPPAFVVQQLDAVVDDLEVAAAKTGMLGGGDVVTAVAERLQLRRLPRLVVDPVIVATSGDSLLADDAVGMLRTALVPLATVVTPNLPEAGALLGRSVVTVAEMREAARDLVALGAGAALVKGGHLRAADGAPSAEALDVLYDGARMWELAVPRVPSARPTHGTGCALSAAITAALACGRPLVDAVRGAKDYVRRAIEAAPGLGHGAAPLAHGVPAWAGAAPSRSVPPDVD
jgi:hydroxymethylpyrimidine/phosphomethylpyrimidine kinase